jgi:uncharacterized protein (DUF924 family)
MRDTKQEIIYFWFEETAPQLWFQISEPFDRTIAERFSVTYEMARDGLSNHWNDDAEGALALCIVLDQFPRHMFRGSPRAYESDAKALVLVKQAIARGFDQLMEPVRRGFLYLPFQHSEQLADQERSLELYTKMKNVNEAGYMYALRHHAAIARFGHFPHRNAILGRESTPEELEFLKNNGGFL